MKKILLLVGGEICHNYFANQIHLLTQAEVDVIVHHSGRDNFEYYFPIYSVGATSEEHKKFAVNFIFRRNLSFALHENYDLLRAPRQRRVFIARNPEKFNLKIGEWASENTYEFAFAYGAPIIRNEAILAGKAAAFNIHIGLSRYYRGGDSNIFALCEEQYDKVGLTCHQLTKKVDEGNVLFEIPYDTAAAVRNIDELNHWLITRATDQVCRIVNGSTITKYEVPNGRLVLNRELTVHHIMQAERNLAMLA